MDLGLVGLCVNTEKSNFNPTYSTYDFYFRFSNRIKYTPNEKKNEKKMNKLCKY